jgi:hypothetical protein
MKDHNADDGDGNTLVWDVDTTSSRYMYGENIEYHSVRIGIVAGGR